MFEWRSRTSREGRFTAVGEWNKASDVMIKHFLDPIQVPDPGLKSALRGNFKAKPLIFRDKKGKRVHLAKILPFGANFSTGKKLKIQLRSRIRGWNHNISK